MNQVRPEPEPINFHSNIRRPGQRFLATNPTPTTQEFRKPNDYWKHAAKDLHAAYNGICAYTSFNLARQGSIDHFLPKTHYPQLAYEWDNLRLASHKVNLYKADSREIVDPFDVRPGWFVLDVPSCLIRPGNGIPKELSEKVNRTIKVLKLNDDDFFVQERCDLMLYFARGDVSLDFLSRRYPFLATEIIRQEISDTARTLFKRRNE